MNALALLLFALLPIEPHDTAIRDYVDLVEVNHCHQQPDDLWKRGFDQLIFWDESNWGYTARGYHFMHHGVEFHGRVVSWKCIDCDCVVSAPAWVETWTQDDPEQTDLVRVPFWARRKMRTAGR